jgi:hypothetical protein
MCPYPGDAAVFRAVKLPLQSSRFLCAVELAGRDVLLSPCLAVAQRIGPFDEPNLTRASSRDDDDVYRRSVCLSVQAGRRVRAPNNHHPFSGKVSNRINRDCRAYRGLGAHDRYEQLVCVEIDLPRPVSPRNPDRCEEVVERCSIPDDEA